MSFGNSNFSWNEMLRAVTRGIYLHVSKPFCQEHICLGFLEISALIRISCLLVQGRKFRGLSPEACASTSDRLEKKGRLCRSRYFRFRRRTRLWYDQRNIVFTAEWVSVSFGLVSCWSTMFLGRLHGPAQVWSFIGTNFKFPKRSPWTVYDHLLICMKQNSSTLCQFLTLVNLW